MNPMRFEIHPAKGGWRVRFTDANNSKVILWSQVYNDRRDAKKAVDLTRAYARTAPLRWFRRIVKRAS